MDLSRKEKKTNLLNKLGAGDHGKRLKERGEEGKRTEKNVCSIKSIKTRKANTYQRGNVKKGLFH